MKFLSVSVLIFGGLVYILWQSKELMIIKVMNKHKIFMVTIHFKVDGYSIDYFARILWAAGMMTSRMT